MNLVVSRAAEDDITVSARWYESEREGLGALFLTELDGLFAHLEEHPTLFQRVYKHVRRAPLRVIAVLHGVRDPSTWRKRYANP